MPSRLRTVIAAVGLAALLAACSAPEVEAPRTAAVASAVHAVSGVTFLPPVGGSEADGPFDPTLDLSLEVFAIDPSSGQPAGGPLGPSFSVDDGTISVVQGPDGDDVDDSDDSDDSDDGDGFYLAVWNTRESGAADGVAVRVEVRLDNAPVDAPACVDDVVDVDDGCLGYLDVRLWRDLGQVGGRGPRGVDGAEAAAAALDLRNGQALPLRIHVRAGAANRAPIVTIEDPDDGASFGASDEIAFTARAEDLEDGDLSADIAWTSDLDGPLGSGDAIQTPLSTGTHQVTASVTDAGGRSGSDTVAVTVEGAVLTDPDWRVDLGGVLYPHAFTYGPSLMADGGVVTTLRNSATAVVAYGPDGTERFRVDTDWSYGFGPLSVGSSGTIYGMRSKDGPSNTFLVAIEPDGDEAWTYPSAGLLFGTPAIAADGTLWSGGYADQLWSHDSTGALLTSAAISNIRTPPVIGRDGSVYVGSLYDRVYKVDPVSGAVESSVVLPGVTPSATTTMSASFSLAERPAGTLLLVPTGGPASTLFALRADDLSLVWQLPNAASDRPVVVGDDVAYLHRADDALVAVELETGSVLWTRADTSLPSLAANGLLYAGVGTELCALDPSGAVVECQDLNGARPRAPLIAPTGELYAVAGSELFRLNVATGGPAATSWPLYYGDPYGTRRLE